MLTVAGFMDDLPEKTVAAKKAVDPDCLKALHNATLNVSRCDFFKCFEERFPCGNRYWMINWGFKYCRRYAESDFNKNFTQTGQQLLKFVNFDCLPKTLEKFYKTKRSIKCRKLHHDIFEAQTKCYIESKSLFCKGFPENRLLFAKAMDKQDMLNYDSMMMVKKAADKCTPKLDLMSMISN